MDLVFKRLDALAWLAIVGCGLVMASATAVAEESLGDVHLSLRQTDAGGATPSDRPRLAVLLIDQTNSMNELEKPGQPRAKDNDSRWAVMRNGVRSTLEQLLAHSKGIKVRMRFFDDTTKPAFREDDFAILDSPAKIDALLSRIPSRPGKGATALYRATIDVAREIDRENKRERFEWIFFGLFSDGGNMLATATEAERNAAIEALGNSDTPFEYFAIPIGSDPQASYGPKATIVDVRSIGGSIPKPRERKASYELELAPKFIEFKQPAKQGSYSLAVRVADDHKAIPKDGLRVIPKVLSGSAMRLASQDPLVVRVATPATLRLEIPAGTDVTKGLSAELTFEPASDDTRPFLCSGTAQLRLAFAADELLPRDKWLDSFPRAIRQGEPATFFLDPGKATNFTWKFTGPGGALPPDMPREKQFERKFPKAGTWAVEFSCTSQADTNKVVTKKLHDIEVVDADFHLEPAKVEVDPGTPATVTIVPNPEATSKATYSADLDDESIPVEGNKVVISADKLRNADTLYLTVSASVEAGGTNFVFGPQKRIIKVKRARIVRLKQGPSAAKSGDASLATFESLPPGVEVVFQVADLDASKVDSITWDCVLSDGQSETKPEKKPVKDFLKVIPQRCGQLVVSANVRIKEGKELREVHLEEHFNVGGMAPSAKPKLIPDVTPIGLLGTSVEFEPGIEGTCQTALVRIVPEPRDATASNDAPIEPLPFAPHQKRVRLPIPSNKYKAGRYEVHLELGGYPGCQPWEEKAPLILTLTPRRKYELWLLSVAALGGIGWLLYAWLWGNDPLRWWIDFSFTDPGPPTADGGGSYMLYIGEAKPAPAGHKTNYLGWNRWRKQAFVPLWLFADRADSADGSWLNDPRWSEITFKIVNVWKNPFKFTGDLAVNWKSEVRYNDLEGAEPISRTLWLQPPWDGAGAPPAMWMRMHCPRGGDRHLWFLWTWLAITIVAAGLLLPYFNIVTF